VDAFGVPAGQIERDHLVSYVLARLPEMALDATFFGGSALCRTHLPGWRLSEDIDLLVPAPARAAEVLADRLPGLLKREHRDCRCAGIAIARRWLARSQRPSSSSASNWSRSTPATGDIPAATCRSCCATTTCLRPSCCDARPGRVPRR
jgi:hypothetical protein